MRMFGHQAMNSWVVCFFASTSCIFFYIIYVLSSCNTKDNYHWITQSINSLHFRLFEKINFWVKFCLSCIIYKYTTLHNHFELSEHNSQSWSGKHSLLAWSILLHSFTHSIVLSPTYINNVDKNPKVEQYSLKLKIL